MPHNQIDLSKIDSTFHISTRTIPAIGPLRLITPKYNKRKWAVNEENYQSLVIDSFGDVVSAGMPKVMELYSTQRTTPIADERYYTVSVWEDGIQIIRSVIHGTVVFRLPKRHDLGMLQHPVMELIESKYPRLLNPTLYDTVSVLLEYCTSEVGCVNYDSPRMYGLGIMGHQIAGAGVKMFPPPFITGSEEVFELQRTFGLYSLQYRESDGIPVSRLQGRANQLMNMKGLICTYPSAESNSARCIKFRSRWYRAAETLQKMSSKDAKALCYERGLYDKYSAQNLFLDLGLTMDDREMRPLNDAARMHTDLRFRCDVFVHDLRLQSFWGLPEGKEFVESLKTFCLNKERMDLYTLAVLARRHGYASDYVQRFIACRWLGMSRDEFNSVYPEEKFNSPVYNDLAKYVLKT